MKILITTDLFTISTNGVVTSVRNLRDELMNKGHDVRVLTLAYGTESYKDRGVYYIKSVPIGFIYPNVRMPISYRNPLIRELIDWKPDVIHSQCEFFSFQFAQHIGLCQVFVGNFPLSFSYDVLPVFCMLNKPLPGYQLLITKCLLKSLS